MEYIEIITKVIIPILGAILMYIVVPFIKKTVIPYINSKTTEAQRNMVYAIVLEIVAAAEQMLKDKDPTGEKRKQYVLDRLKNKGIDINMDELNDMIESAVLEINIVKGKFEYAPDFTGDSRNDLKQ